MEDFRVVHIDETDSTNRWLRENGKGNMIVVASYQTAGRGCGQNTWESERGKNLTFSVLFHPRQVPAADQFILSMANALALKEAIGIYVDNVKIKWPNDIYWRDRKICGTLIETALQGSLIKDCIIGTGINVNQRTFHNDAPNPVSLCQILGRETDTDELLQRVTECTMKYMRLVEDGAWDTIRTNYRRHLYRLNESHLYRIGSEQKRCQLADVTDDGHLRLLIQETGQAAATTADFAFKEVSFII